MTNKSAEQDPDVATRDDVASVLRPIRLPLDVPNVRDLVRKIVWTDQDSAAAADALRADLGTVPLDNDMLRLLALETLDSFGLLVDLARARRQRQHHQV